MTVTTTILADVRAHPQGWSKHELADLHRAAELMQAGRLRIATDCGVTDEGDPWFVFCDGESGDVIAHFARIDSKYIACVPFQHVAMTGRVFPDLIEQFLQRRAGVPALSLGIRSTPAA